MFVGVQRLSMMPHVIVGGSQTIPGIGKIWREFGGAFPRADSVIRSPKRRKGMRLAYPAHRVVAIMLDSALKRQQCALWLTEVAKCVGACAPGERAAGIESNGATGGDERLTVAIHLMQGDAASRPGAGAAWQERDGAIIGA